MSNLKNYFSHEKIGKFLVKKITSDNLVRIGSKYGGWFICQCEAHLPEVGYFISAGVGEDISFDIELLRKTKFMAILIDPTEKSAQHMNQYLTSSHRKNITSYNSTGKQEIANYYGEKSLKERILFVNKALWTTDQGVNLFPPINSEHVSFRITSQKGDNKLAINFKSITIPGVKDILHNTRIKKKDSLECHILKMDIEGSEFEVLKSIKKSNCNYKQILVEFDFLRSSIYIIQLYRLIFIVRKITNLGYRLAHIQGLNFTFLSN